MKITDIKFRKILKKGKMKAVVSITFNKLFAVHDIKIIEGRDGYFVAMPNRKLENGEFIDMAHPTSKAMREIIEKSILEKYFTYLIENK